MTIERTMVCDNCGGIIAAEDTVARLRKVSRDQRLAKLIDGLDYCADCIKRGYPKREHRSR